MQACFGKLSLKFKRKEEKIRLFNIFFETDCDNLLVGCLTPQQHAGVSQGRTCLHKFSFCHTEIEVADLTVYLTQSQYTDTRPTSPSADP